MEFLSLFSLKDVFFAGTGLVLVSMLRIYYDSYVDRKKVKHFSTSLSMYNSLFEESRDGLLILSEHNKIIFVNKEAADILKINIKKPDSKSLFVIDVENEENRKSKSFLDFIHTDGFMANGYLVNNANKLPIYISVNKVNILPEVDEYYCVVHLRDMTNINKLREGTMDLLS